MRPVSLLAGFILLGFLLGELTNTMTNLDPVGNKFKQTRDSLTEFMSKHQFSSSLRRKLKEYITLRQAAAQPRRASLARLAMPSRNSLVTAS